MPIISYSTLPLLESQPMEAVKSCVELGADKVELFMDGTHWSHITDNHKEGLIQQLRRAGAQYSIHAPHYDLNMASEWGPVRAVALEQYKKTIRFAGRIQATHVVISPGIIHPTTFDKEKSRHYAAKGIKTLIPTAKQCKVKLAIENGGDRQRELFDHEAFISFIHSFNEEVVGAVLDVGHAHITRWPIELVMKELSSKLLALHINDTRGNVDNHLPIGQGAIDWERVFQTIKMLDIEPDLVLEYNMRTPVEELPRSKEAIHDLFKEKSG